MGLIVSDGRSQRSRVQRISGIRINPQTYQPKFREIANEMCGNYWK